MARKAKSESKKTGLYHARDTRRMSRSELVRRSGVSKQQLSRLENGLIRLRLDHLKPFASALGYSPEQILLWGHYPGTSDDERGNRRGKFTGSTGPPRWVAPSGCRARALGLPDSQRGLVLRQPSANPGDSAGPDWFGTRASQVQILPLRPRFSHNRSLAGNDMGNETPAPMYLW